jgi:hypothetical protein
MHARSFETSRALVGGDLTGRVGQSRRPKLNDASGDWALVKLGPLGLVESNDRPWLVR